MLSYSSALQRIARHKVGCNCFKVLWLIPKGFIQLRSIT